MRRGSSAWRPQLWLAAVWVVGLLVACGGTPPGGPTPEPDPDPDPGIRELIGDADADGRLDAQVAFTVVSGASATAIATSSTAPTRPTMMEVDATTPGGRPFRAVLVGTQEEALAAGFEGVLRMRGRTTEVNGRTVLVGYAAVVGGDGEGRLGGYSFLAARSVDVPAGPVEGAVYNLDGTAFLAGFCTEDHVAAGALLTNRNESLRVVNALALRRPQRLPCPPGTEVNGPVRMNLESEAVVTRIGTVLVGYGAVEVRRGDAVATLPAFSVSLPERLSDTFRQERFDGEVAAGAYVLDPFAAAALERVVGGTMFFRELPEGLEGVTAGDLLVARPFPRLPEGLLRRVTDVRLVEQGVAVDTEDADLSDLLRAGGFSFDRELGLDDIVEVVALTDGVDLSAFDEAFAAAADAPRGAVATSGGLIPTIRIDKQVFPGIRVEGALDINVRPEISFQCRGTLCSQPEIRGVFVIEQSAEMAVLGDGAFGDTRRFELAQIKLGTIVVAIPPVPVTITPVIVVALTVSGNGDVGFESRVTQSITFTGGVEKPSGEPWAWVRELERDFDFEPPTFEGSLSTTARLSVGAEVRVYGGVLEAGADVGGFVRLTGQIPGNPMWALDGGFDAYAYFGIDLLVIRWSDDLQLFERTWPIARSENTPPTIQVPTILTPFSPPLAPPATGFGNPTVLVDSEVEVTTSVADVEDGNGCCRVDWFLRNPDGSLERFDTTGRNPVLSFVPEELGRYALRAVAYDALLAKDERTIEFDVVDASLIEQLYEIELEQISVGTPAPGDAVTFQARFDNPYDLDCCTLAWRITRLGAVDDGVFGGPELPPGLGIGGPTVIDEFTTSAAEFHVHTRTFNRPGNFLIEVTPVDPMTQLFGGDEPRFGFPLGRQIALDVLADPQNPPEIVHLNVQGTGPFVAGRELLIHTSVDWYQPGPNRTTLLRTQDDGVNVVIHEGTGSGTSQLIHFYTYDTAGTKRLQLRATGDDGLVSVFETTILIIDPGSSGNDGLFGRSRTGEVVPFP